MPPTDPQPVVVGKRVVEDVGTGWGRTNSWPAVPKDLCKDSPSWGSTSIVCDKCGRPWGGLVYDRETESFRHRRPCALRDFI
jgi:hypothetical protein